MIELTALFHRPDSEYAYLYKKNVVHLRFRTKRNNVQSIRVHHGDPFIFYQQGYQYQILDFDETLLEEGLERCAK